MIFREALIADIPAMHNVRISVKENPLPDPGLITYGDYKEFIIIRGKGWVCESNNKITGFAIIDLKEKNVWALFVMPGFEGKGIGKQLHNTMLNWYFSKTSETIWLGTAPGTRAAVFYRKAGWSQTGIRPNGEIRFEMKKNDWLRKL
ncbi:MAG TPA: GNAT family N-acetyltransferase [Chitinophagaceae bacterium]|nr:GNAT family N-acetyltransferase [Chitinophagaceae bacterium]